MFRLIGYSFDPRYWNEFVQQIRLAKDATPAILPMAICGVLCFSTGLLSPIPYAHELLVFSLAPLLVLSLLGATFAMLDSVRHVIGHAVRSYFDSQLYFELARASLLLGGLMAIVTGICIYWNFSIVEFTSIPIAITFGIFLIASSTGFLITWRRKDKPASAAYDCVDFFLPQCLAVIAVTVPVILLAKSVEPMYVITAIVIAALLSIVVLKINEWTRTSRNRTR